MTMRATIVLVSVLAVVPDAGAQPVGSFRELTELIELGRDGVVITSPDGDVIAGEVVDISPTSMSMLAGGIKVELHEARVRSVRQRWNDPTWDGALVGFAAGSGPLLVAYAIWTKDEGPPSRTAFTGMMMLSVALGVGGGLIGATLDGSRTREAELYRRPQPRVSVSPLLARDRIGAVLATSW